MRFVLPLCVTFCLPALTSAQAHPLVGRWNLSMPAPMRGADGKVSMVTRKSVMTVELAGDSLIATVRNEPLPGEPDSGDRRFAGIRNAGAVRLVHASTATLSGGSRDMSREASTIYVLDASGDKVTGTLTVEVPGIDGIPPRTVTGTLVRR